MKEIKYYVSSSGEKTPINEVDTVHLINGFAKKCKMVYDAENRKEAMNAMVVLNDIFEELSLRMNDFINDMEE